MFNGFNPWGLLFKHCQRQKNLLFNMWVAWDGFMGVVDALTVSWVFPVLGSRRRQTLASYRAAVSMDCVFLIAENGYIHIWMFFNFILFS